MSVSASVSISASVSASLRQPWGFFLCPRKPYVDRTCVLIVRPRAGLRLQTLKRKLGLDRRNPPLPPITLTLPQIGRRLIRNQTQRFALFKAKKAKGSGDPRTIKCEGDPIIRPLFVFVCAAIPNFNANFWQIPLPDSLRGMVRTPTHDPLPEPPSA